MRDEATLCTLNNIAWCDTICRAHHMPGSLNSDMWIQPRRGPPYYSNGTVSRENEVEQIAAIEKLKVAFPDGFSIKDSFAALDLAKNGFRVLFDAEWLWLDPIQGRALQEPPLPQPSAYAEGNPLPTRGRGAGGQWFKVESETELVAWEAAWAAAGSPTATRVFLPTLIDQKSIAFFGARQDGKIVAGCAANCSEGNVVGFSNFFAPASGRESFRAAAVVKVMEFAPGASVVGYERGDDLAGMLSLGFRSVGKLRVWLWP